MRPLTDETRDPQTDVAIFQTIQVRKSEKK